MWTGVAVSRIRGLCDVRSARLLGAGCRGGHAQAEGRAVIFETNDERIAYGMLEQALDTPADRFSGTMVAAEALVAAVNAASRDDPEPEQLRSIDDPRFLHSEKCECRECTSRRIRWSSARILRAVAEELDPQHVANSEVGGG